MLGVADHFGLDPDDLGVGYDWLGTYPLPAGCSVAFYPGAGTKDGHGILSRNFDFPTATFTQMAGVEALTGPQDDVEAMVEEFRRRRDVIVDGLNAIPGVSCVRPKGAFYAFPNISRLGVDTKTFANLLLDDYGVATLAGTAFGRYGDGYLRLSYANSIENIEKALDRFGKAASSLLARA